MLLYSVRFSRRTVTRPGRALRTIHRQNLVLQPAEHQRSLPFRQLRLVDGGHQFVFDVRQDLLPGGGVRCEARLVFVGFEGHTPYFDPRHDTRSNISSGSAECPSRRSPSDRFGNRLQTVFCNGRISQPY